MYRAILPICVVLPILSLAQGLVSQEPMNRTVLLEEYAAIKCGNCPAAHVIAGSILDANPDEVVGVEIHGGSLAVPSSGQPDFRTEEGTMLWSQFGVTFQPQGMVNREGLISPSNYISATNAALAMPSPVNIGVSASFDPGPRLLSVEVELYYTADGSGDNDRIFVLLTEDHIIGYQQDYVNGAQPNYDHRHVLRDYITLLAGDEVMDNSMGSSVVRSYSFTVPEEWNIEQCAAVAFIGEPSVGSIPGPIHQVRSVAASGGSTTNISAVVDADIGQAYPVPANDVVAIPIKREINGGILQLRDGTGRLVRSERITTGQRIVLLDVSGLANGSYHYGLAGERAWPLVVVH